MKVVVATPIAREAIERLQRRHDLVLAYEGAEPLVEVIRDGEGLIFRSGVTISGDVIDAAPNLRLIVRAGSGLDNIDLARARQRGIRVVRVPGVSPQAVAGRGGGDQRRTAGRLSGVRRRSDGAEETRAVRGGHSASGARHHPLRDGEWLLFPLPAAGSLSPS